MEGTSRGRLIAFRIVAGLAALLSLLTVVFAVSSFTDDAAAIHRFHNTSMAILFMLCMAVPLVMAIKDPGAAVAPFRLWLGVTLAGVVSGIFNGDLVQPDGPLILIILAAITYGLNPAVKEVNSCVKANIAQAAISVVALVPAFMYALSQSDLQRTLPETNEHVEFHHYAGSGWIALSIGICGLAASFPGSGKRLAGRLIGTAAILLGLLSLVLPHYEGAYDTPWAAATVAFGVIYTALGEMDARKAMVADQAETAPSVA